MSWCLLRNEKRVWICSTFFLLRAIKFSWTTLNLWKLWRNRKSPFVCIFFFHFVLSSLTKHKKNKESLKIYLKFCQNLYFFLFSYFMHDFSVLFLCVVNLLIFCIIWCVKYKNVHQSKTCEIKNSQKATIKREWNEKEKT